MQLHVPSGPNGVVTEALRLGIPHDDSLVGADEQLLDASRPRDDLSAEQASDGERPWSRLDASQPPQGTTYGD